MYTSATIHPTQAPAMKRGRMAQAVMRGASRVQLGDPARPGNAHG
jgi:hypothetical protein